MYKTLVDCERAVEGLKSNSADRLRELFGEDPDFQAAEVPCWPEHHDPKVTILETWET